LRRQKNDNALAEFSTAPEQVYPVLDVDNHYQKVGHSLLGAYVPCCNAALSFGSENPPSLPSKPDIPPDGRWRVPMKNLFFAALAALSLGAATVPAFAHSTVADDAVATRYQRTGAL
jgi:hypothetical protein